MDSSTVSQSKVGKPPSEVISLQPDPILRKTAKSKRSDQSSKASKSRKSVSKISSNKFGSEQHSKEHPQLSHRVASQSSVAGATSQRKKTSQK